MRGVAHPLAHLFRVVAARERRFDPFRTSDQPFRLIAELRLELGGTVGADGSPGLTRRIAGLSLAYRLGAIAAPAITALAATRRLPDLSAGNVLVDDSAGARIERFSLRSLRFFCLPDDPDADHPDATVVDAADTLRERFHALYTRAWLADTSSRPSSGCRRSTRKRCGAWSAPAGRRPPATWQL